MPLAERDINTQHHLHLTRCKRLPAALSVTDENATLSPTTPRAKDSPTHQQRFLAPTKASVAKNTPPPSADRARIQPPSSKSIPSPHGSKLPRRNAATPTPKSPLSPPISKWNRCVATDCIEDLNGRAEPSSSGETAKDNSLIALDSFPRRKQLTRVEKPLPPRPIASLVYAPSPSRDSRCLIDASERPLRLSRGESEYDWPTLMPTSSSTPTFGPATSYTTRTGSTPDSLPMSTSATPMANITPDFSGGRSDSNIKVSGSPDQRHSSVSSYTSTSDSGPVPESVGGVTQPLKHDKTPPRSTATVPPPRKSSLPSHHGLLIERSRSTGANMSGSPEFARDMFEASRPHSPSPASFSRPRPTSISQVSAPMTPPPAVVDATPIKSEKTASRIPWPDQKKATLVDIKGRRASSIPIPKFEKGLSFGGRRFDSPDPLKVLDHGIKRRQLKRDGSSSTVSTVPTGVLSHSTPPVDRNKANTPDSTRCSTTEDEEEVTTPSDKPNHFVKHGYKPKHVNRVSGSHYAGATLKVYDEAEVVLGRPPPSNSPFTFPLQTIPSQSLLPMRSISNRYSLEVEQHPKVVIKPTEFSAFAQRLSILEDSHTLGTNDSHNSNNTIRDDTKSELVDILREAEHEDALISQCGATGLDAATKEEVTRTLSMLAGTCGPASTTVNLEHLSYMFGRLKSGFEKAPKSAAFVEDATVADRFLARRGSTSSDQVIRAQANGSYEAPVTSHRREGDADSQLSRSKTVASKWSTSTASVKERPLPARDTTSRQNTLSVEFEDLPQGLPPKDSLHSHPPSIGYPSRVPGKAHRILGTDERETSNFNRRSSSPTLGSRVPGSVRAAREKARDAAGSRANQASATKVEKLPTPNTKVFRMSQDPPRGRLPSADRSTNRVSTKLPRSRSKSRYVFDKINGLFSGRRDRRESKLPPVPPVKDSFDHPTPAVAPKEVRTTSLGSPMLTGPKVPPLTKMPTISPPVDSVHPALRSAPSSASVAPSTTTVGSDADYEGRCSLQALSEKLLGRAIREGDPARKERLLNFAKVFNDSLISAREAQISAETAQSAARSAQLSYEMTMRSVAMLQRLASSMNRR